MTVFTSNSATTEYSAASVTEQTIVAHLIRFAEVAGVQAAPASVVNLYVSLKSKPLAILVGPEQSGKTELVQNLAQVLTTGDPFQCQFMNSHARWASKSGNVAFFMEVQTRLIAAKLLALIEEAWQPENRQRVFLACLTHISPSELLGFFSELAPQLRSGQIVNLPTLYLSEPVSFPPNLFLVGTIDTQQFRWLDSELLSNTTVIQCSNNGLIQPVVSLPDILLKGAEAEFLRALIRDEGEACQKLHRILIRRREALHTLFSVEQVLKNYNIQPPASARCDFLVYLANAWSKDGVGLFDPDLERNLTYAIDFALAQTLLPYVSKSIADATMIQELQNVLDQLPHSLLFLQSLL